MFEFRIVQGCKASSSGFGGGGAALWMQGLLRKSALRFALRASIKKCGNCFLFLASGQQPVSQPAAFD